MLIPTHNKWLYDQIKIESEILLDGWPCFIDPETYREKLEYWTHRAAIDRAEGRNTFPATDPANIAGLHGDISDLGALWTVMESLERSDGLPHNDNDEDKDDDYRGNEGHHVQPDFPDEPDNEDDDEGPPYFPDEPDSDDEGGWRHLPRDHIKEGSDVLYLESERRDQWADISDGGRRCSMNPWQTASNDLEAGSSRQKGTYYQDHTQSRATGLTQLASLPSSSGDEVDADMADEVDTGWKDWDSIPVGANSDLHDLKWAY
ncbi:hypothetical protein SUNI508_03382 [Seiridium unicorne]|uniref:Uncharacterized protein n=1 Tax=Seiridium unicorne TaxID=138068 RepID=A0ABR2VCI5_9PEZI